jgi:hypothetical protein
MRFQDFSSFLAESSDFETRTVNDPAELSPGDEVFHMGKWQTVQEIRKENVAVFDDDEKVSVIRNSDIEHRGVLVKLTPPDDDTEQNV